MLTIAQKKQNTDISKQSCSAEALGDPEDLGNTG